MTETLLPRAKDRALPDHATTTLFSANTDRPGSHDSSHRFCRGRVIRSLGHDLQDRWKQRRGMSSRASRDAGGGGPSMSPRRHFPIGCVGDADRRVGVGASTIVSSSGDCSSSTTPAMVPLNGGDTTYVTYAGCPSRPHVEVTGCSIHGGATAGSALRTAAPGVSALGKVVGKARNFMKRTDQVGAFFNRLWRRSAGRGAGAGQRSR
jgi:hypothetical protein